MMVKRIVVFIGIVALTIPLIGSVASALPNFALSASPQVVDFGNVRPVLGIVSQTVTISNVSADNLGGGVYGYRGDVNLPAGFSVNPDPRVSTCIASGGSFSGTTVGLQNNGNRSSCTFSVRFDPTQLPQDTYTGRLNVTIGLNTITVVTVAQVVRGIPGGPNPNLALSANPSIVDFGLVAPAGGIVSQTVTISNVSADNLPGGRYVFLGDVNLPAGFSVNPDPGLSTCIASGGSLSGTTVGLLNNGPSCTLTVRFDPTQLPQDSYQGRLNITLGGNTLRVLAVANIARGIPGGPNPNFSLDASPEYVDFGLVWPALGTVSASVTITNVSAANLNGGRYVFLGDTNLPGGFNVDPDPNFSSCIAVGGSLSGTTRGLLSNGRGCTFTVRFDPTQLPEGGYTGRLNVTIGGSTIRVLAFANIARGIPGGPNPNLALSANPSIVDFGPVLPAGGTVSQTVTISNVSADNLPGGFYAFLGDVNLPAGFSVNPDPGMSTCIASGGSLSGTTVGLFNNGPSCTLTVRFDPTQLPQDSYQGRLNITMGGNTLRLLAVADVVRGLPGGPNPNFALTANPQPIDFGRVQPALGTVSASVTITNASAAALPGGRYVFLGDTNLPGGFNINPDPGLSTCIASGGSLSGTTVALLSHGTCTFTVRFDPTQLTEDSYLGRLNVTLGGNTLRVLAVADIARGIPGLPNPNYALDANPPYVNFGRVRPALGPVTQTVTIENASAEPLPSGRYVFLGDVNLPAGFSVNPDPGLSTCITSGGSLSGTTVGLLSNGPSCTFTVRFDPTQLPSGDYLGRINITMGGNTLRLLAFAEVVRIIG
jgi:hypothetical protein